MQDLKWNIFFFEIFFLAYFISMSGFPYIKHPPPYTFFYYTSMSGGYTNLTLPITQPSGVHPLVLNKLNY